MNTMHDLLKKEFDLLLPRMVVDLVLSKIREQGISLTKREKQKLLVAISNNQLDNIKYRNWNIWERREIVLEITEDDIDSIEKKANTLIDKMPELLEAILDNAAEYMVTTLEKRWGKERSCQYQERRIFEKDLAKIWGHPLDLLGMILTIATELGANINDELRNEKESNRNKSICVLTSLHARGCQVGWEILKLLYSGYADGAMARWRTLHEIAVIALFIQDNGEEIAERYMQHASVESYKAALNYEKYRERLGYEPFEQSELARLKNVYDEVKKLYGREFTEEYGWASTIVRKTNTRFADIERSVSIDHLRPYYKLASYNVHANPKGVFFKLGLLPETQILLAGPSDFGLADPGQNTAYSLCLLTSTLVMLNPNVDAVLSLKIIESFSKKAAESFVEIQKQFDVEIDE